MTYSIEIFPWNENFNTDITEIDEQHKVLVEIINQLATHLGNNSDRDVLDETFKKLADYATFHFKSEEKIWEKYFPSNSSLKGHKETHNDFLKAALNFKIEQSSKPSNTVIEKVLSFLTHWLAHHILDSDMRMSKIISAMQTGLSLESSQQKVDKEMSGVMSVMLDTTLAMYDHLCTRTLELNREVRKRQKIEKELCLASSVFENTLDGICITDTNNTIVRTNPSFYRITGYKPEEIIGKNPRILSSGKQSPEFYSRMWQTINTDGYWQGEIWNRRKDGEIYPELLTISPIVDNNKKITHYLGLFRDITSTKEQQTQLELMAHYDVLTQLPNRLLLTDRFTRSIAHCKRTNTQLAVCFLDLDDFKPVNDNHGHEIGDQLLIKVAERIKNTIRDDDTVSRHGGDEFILLLGDITSFTQCTQTLDRLIQSLSQPYLVDKLSITISASIGVSLYPADNSDLDTLMRHADQAMYQAKLAGRNQYTLFNTEQDKLITQKHVDLQEIEHALLNNELCLYYQPKVNMKIGEVFGAEALIRWIHPEKGLIPPLKFLPLIEGTNLEVLIGNWVINEALHQLSTWVAQGIKIEVSINISSYHLQSPDFIKTLDSTLAAYPTVNTEYLQLEILESSVLSDLQSVSKIIQTCIDSLGVNIALDDFGTGYSSLTHLRNLPAKTIKIDQTFVRDLLDDPNDHAIIDGIIGLAHSFNREVIAEGVETIDQGIMLLVMGCTKIQGYGVSRPMPADEIPQWLQQYTVNQEWISCANKTRTTKENKVKLFRLAVKQWQKQFENNIQSLPEEIKNWPIMKKTKCHCGIWIKRAMQEQLFEDTWINKLDIAHESMHYIADDLFKKYQQDNFTEARGGLKQFNEAIMKMSTIIGLCE